MKLLYKLPAAALLLVWLSGCQKTVEGYSNNPTASAEQPPVPFLINAGELGVVTAQESLARTGSIWAKSLTGIDRQFISTNNYVTTTGDYDNDWSIVYQKSLAQLKLAETAALQVNYTKSAGIAEVLMALSFGTAADLWGDVPYTQALNDQLYPRPKFDAQAAVYDSVQALLSRAIANLTSNLGPSPAGKDFLFGGDAAKWRAVAYTLKARFYLHTKQYTQAIAAAANGVASADGSLYAPHGTTYLSDFNLWYSFLTYDRPGYISADGAYSVSLLDAASTVYRGNSKTNEGARFNYLYQPGLNTGGLDPNVLCDFDWGVPTNETGFFGGNESFPMVTYYENNLILAEANMKLATPNFTIALAALNAHRAYLASASSYVRSGYNALGKRYDAYVTADFAAGGIENPTPTVSANDALLREILQERYVSFIGQIEQFNDVRRTKNRLGIPPVTGTKLPQRYLYAQSEINTNPNTPAISGAGLFTETPANTSAY